MILYDNAHGEHHRHYSRTGAEQVAEAVSGEDKEFLVALGKRVRDLRDRRGMTRKLLARADVSERYLGQLELGNGNISVMLPRWSAGALSVTLAEVLTPEKPSISC